MVQAVAISDTTSFYDLETNFNLQLNDDPAAFAEWHSDLPELTTQEKERLDQVKAHFLALTRRSPISENLVKMAVVSPLLEVAGFYSENVQVRDEIPVEISGLDKDILYRGRIDILVFQEKLWVVAIEAKHSQFSLLKAMPQALAYMVASPNADQEPPQATFGLITNGSDFRFLKVTHQSDPVYSVSSIFSSIGPGNDLYAVSQILKGIAQQVLPEC